MAFQARWRELKKAGWTSKRPSGLSVDFTYLKPGKTIKNVKGEDVFVGEVALMQYLDKLDLDSAIRPRNLDPDFEETHESSDSSEDSEDEDQSETNAMHPGVVEESKEASQVFDLSVEGWSNLYVHVMNSVIVPGRLLQCVKTTPICTAVTMGQTRWLAAAATPSGAFFYFLQPQPWENIAAESTEYLLASIDERVEGQHAKQVARERKHNEYNAKSRVAIREDVLKAPPIEARELCVFIGLLIARSIVPNKEKLANHWKTREEGAIPRGCFGRFMTRDRFMHISINLHFGPNDDPNAMTDRAWKLRPVIDALQERFAAGYTPPAIMAMRRCCRRALRSTVCVFFGPTAPPNGEMRLVVMDRFYSSVPLSMQLLTMGFYSIGMERTDRQGLSTKLIPKKRKGDKKKPPKIPKNRPANIERGTFIVADSLHVPAMRVLRWWDTRAVDALSTGGSVQQDRIVRRDALSGEQQEVACPRVVKDYQTYMGGVDVHDQLRLQR
ncbi:unnamed protein product [Phytophthora fragariaefolia]|uniref:Unnamed protein product n=1 Tax=Phytophthora fragariaefolia TaxID=1490495 RepID=A0A9W6XIC6_9STRA|nr:unnamed protein product [Phytophthora fragariaefolia]